MNGRRPARPVARFGAVLVGIVLLSGCGGKAQRDAMRRAAAELQTALARRPPAYVLAHHDGPRIWKTLGAFYAERRYQPAWIQGTKPDGRLDALLRALDGAGHHGLDPALYDLGPLSESRSQARFRMFGTSGFDPALVAPLELRLTAAWLAYASDLSNGVTARPHADPMWKVKPRAVNLLPVLKEAVASDEVEEALDALAPSNEEYRRLQSARERHAEIAKAGGWPTLPPRLTLRPGQSSAYLAALARRLVASGDLPAGTAERPPQTYDDRLQQGVQRFRARHGLPVTPALTAGTVAAMNVPVERRIRQIELNMERWRWFPRDLGERHIRVNVPEYHLELHESSRVALAMKVIVGANDKPTPIFSDTMTSVVFAPYWNVPSSIAADETLPAVMSDPEFLERNNLEVVSLSGELLDPSSIDWATVGEDADAFPFRFRQRPGTTNSLGRVKFLFPNDFDVYLHDTPAAALFAKNNRALSHGCVRLEQPVQLAEHLLQGASAWTSARIERAMNSEEEQHVRLPRPIPVHLMYWTARVDGQGTIFFFDDIYGHDARQWKDYQGRLGRVRAKKEEIRKKK